jgi:hypothetical protein
MPSPHQRRAAVSWILYCDAMGGEELFCLYLFGLSKTNPVLPQEVPIMVVVPLFVLNPVSLQSERKNSQW